jgi:hypothetical protein
MYISSDGVPVIFDDESVSQIIARQPRRKRAK